MGDGEDAESRRRPTLEAAYAELNDLLLDGSDVQGFLAGLAALASSLVPDTSCGITLKRGRQVLTAASSGTAALMMDEFQYLHGRGPCLEALDTGARIDVADTALERRWSGFGEFAESHGIRSSVSFPMLVDGTALGALNMFARRPHAFSADDVARLTAFTHQAATTLTLLLRQVSRLTLNDQLQEALVTRAVIDQALGILMYKKRIGSREAFEILRHVSQTTNRRMSTVAEEIIVAMTGHAPEPPRPLSVRPGSTGAN